MNAERTIAATSAEAGTVGALDAVSRADRVKRLLFPAILAAICLALFIAAASIWLVRPDEEGAIFDNGDALAEELGLPKGHACGDQTTRFRLAPHGARQEVFALTKTWFWVRKCLTNLLAVAEEQPVSAPIHAFLERQVQYVMSQRPVRFYRFGDSERLRLKDIAGGNGRLDRSLFDRVVYTNKRGIAHNSMSQAEIGIWLIEAKRKLAERGLHADVADEYEALGIAAFRVILDSVADGGLRGGGVCDLKPAYRCAWYHAVTNPTRKSSTEGGTLNKHLLVIKNLELAAMELMRIDAVEPSEARRNTASELQKAADEGIHQLVYSSGHRAPGLPPNLLDYIARDDLGAPIGRSWLYYGLNPERPRHGYFLRVNNFKNCHYHLFDMALLRDIFAGPGHDTDLSGFTQFRPELGKSLVAFIVEAYETKATEGLFADSPTIEGGNYAGCRKELLNAAEFAKVVDYLANLQPSGP